MKKLLLMLMVLFMALGISAKEVFYTIDFTKTTSTSSTAFTASDFVNKAVKSGSDYITSISDVQTVFPDANSVKFSSSNSTKGIGKFTINLSEKGQVSPSKIVVNAKLKSSTIQFKLNGTAITGLNASNYADGSVTLSGKLTSLSFEAPKQSGGAAWLKSITVYYDDGTGSGSEKPSLPVVEFNGQKAEDLGEYEVAENTVVSISSANATSLSIESTANGTTETVPSSSTTLTITEDDIFEIKGINAQGESDVFTVSFTIKADTPVEVGTPVVTFTDSDGNPVTNPDSDFNYIVMGPAEINVSCENATRIKVSKDGSAFSTLHGASGTFTVTEGGTYTIQGINGTNEGPARTVNFQMAIGPVAPTVSFTTSDGTAVSAAGAGLSYEVTNPTTINVTCNGATCIEIKKGDSVVKTITGSTGTYDVTEAGAYSFVGYTGTTPGVLLTVNFTFKAETPSTSNKYELVNANTTNALEDGALYVIASGSKAIGTSFSSGGFAATDVTITDNVLTATESVEIFQLKISNGKYYWNFKEQTSNRKGLSATTSTSNKANLVISNDAEASNVTFSSNNAKIVFASQTSRQIMMNGSTFKNYVPSTSGVSQIQLYKQVKSDPVDYTLPEQTGEVTIGETTYQIQLGEKHPAKVTYSIPEQWTEYATVSESGEVTGLMAGSISVNVNWEADDNFKAGGTTVNVIISNPLQDPELAFLHEVIYGKINVGVAAQAAFHLGNGNVTYSSNNPSVVTVSETTGMITPADVHAVGEAIITATIAATDTYRGATATYKVVIETPDQGNLAPAGSYMFDFRDHGSYGLFKFSDSNCSGDNNKQYYEYNINTKPGEEFQSHEAVSSITPDGCPVTLTLGGSYRSWQGTGSNYHLRLYNIDAVSGSMTFSVPEEYSIEKITVNGEKFGANNLEANIGTWDKLANEWTSNQDGLREVTLTRTGDSYVIIKTMTVVLKKAESNRTLADLKFGQRVYNTYVGVATKVNAVTSSNEIGQEGTLLTYDNIKYEIDNLDGDNYFVDRSDEANNNLVVTVYKPGVYTFRVKSGATADLLPGVAILRLNVFPQFEMATENHVKTEKDETNADVVVFPAEGGKIKFNIVKDKPEYRSASVVAVESDGTAIEHDGEIFVEKDAVYDYQLTYAETEYFIGRNTIHAFVTPKAPTTTKDGNYHVITLADGQSAQGACIRWHAFRFTPSGASQAPARAAAAEDGWNEETSGTESHSIEIPFSTLGDNEIFIVESEAVKHTNNSLAGELYSDRTMVGYNKDGSLSGIEDITATVNAPVEFYNLQGIKVEGELVPGVYIRRQGARAEKIVIR